MTKRLKISDFVDIGGKSYKLSEYPPAYIEFLVNEHGEGYYRDVIEEWEVTPDQAPIEVCCFNWCDVYFFPGNGIANAEKGETLSHQVGVASDYTVEFLRDDTARWSYDPALEERTNPYEQLDWCLANAAGPWLLHYRAYRDCFVLNVTFLNKDDEMRWKLTWHGVEGGEA